MQVTPPLFDPNSRRGHDYDTQAKPRNFLDDLNHAASAAWRDEMKLHLPPQYKNVPIYQHICNLYLGICSCKSFISKGQPYLCKHLYAVHASRHNLKCEEKILNLGKYMVPTLTPYLAEYFKINNHREMFGKSNLDVVNNLIAQSHEASTTEVNLAKQGKILTTLHSGPFQSTTFHGTPPKRAPHNAGKRRVGGPSLENRYSLTQQNFNCADPYVPKVEFPSNARGRHCGRKRTRTATRGTNICKLQEQAINKLENKMNEAGEGTENEPKLKRRRVATNKKVNSTEVTMVCSHCIQEGIGNPFIASTQKMLNDHISRAHATFICGLCFSELGTFIKFSSKIKLDSHVAESHNKN